MRSLLLLAEQSDQEFIIAELWQLGTVGIIEERQTLRAVFEDTAEWPVILERFSSRTIEITTEPSLGFRAIDEVNCDPILIGRQFWTAPAGFIGTPPPDRIRLTVGPSAAFGSGRHESTQLMVEALEQHLQPCDIVLDIGSGSGILSNVASLLGSGRVFACDIQCDAPSNAIANRSYRYFLGSADAIRPQAANLVLVNISARVIDLLASELNRITKPDGLLVLAGFVRENPPSCFAPEETLERNDWLCWVCRPDSIAVSGLPKAPLSHSLQWW